MTTKRWTGAARTTAPVRARSLPRVRYPLESYRPRCVHSGGVKRVGESVGQSGLRLDPAPRRRPRPMNPALAAARAEWDSLAFAAIAREARSGRQFQAHDLTVRQGLAEPDHPNRWGGALARAAAAGLIEAVGFTRSTRPTTHRALTTLWRGRGVTA